MSVSERKFVENLKKCIRAADSIGGQPAQRAKARQRRPMGNHDVRLTTRHLRVEGIDLDFDVKRDGRMLGTLSISEGGLLWRPANFQKRNGISVSWAEFASWAESE
jgi:hypothetical protein